MRKVSFITPPDSEYGFNLTGLSQAVVADFNTVEETLKGTMEETGDGLVIIDERLLAGGRENNGIPEERLKELEQRWPGILLVLPSPDRPPAEEEDYAARLIRRAIGYHVKLKL